MAESTKKRFHLLVLDGNPIHDWCELFPKQLANGSSLHVTQASWIETNVTVYSDSGCMISVSPIRESDAEITRPQTMTIRPDFVLIRNQPRGPTPGSDKRNVLFGMMAANISAINSLASEYMNLERPIMNGALRAIEKRLGYERFPFIEQNYYSDEKSMIISPPLPAIIKVSHAHAGMGKIRIESQDMFRDISTVLALHGDYCTGEPYIEVSYGIRVQKIGTHYRVMKKNFTGSGWKSQFGGADLQEIDLTEKYKLWVDECAKCFGGMDLLAVDAVHSTDGQDYIIEMNGTAIGLLPSRWLEDSQYICDLVLERLNELFPISEARDTSVKVESHTPEKHFDNKSSEKSEKEQNKLQSKASRDEEKVKRKDEKAQAKARKEAEKEEKRRQKMKGKKKPA